ncbi:MAG TPA: nucleotide exchange factor GrpE [Planctomycetota bacterium]|nr:nucleotide exchange factor GrpE [Planctomycetota bacterium]
MIKAESPNTEEKKPDAKPDTKQEAKSESPAQVPEKLQEEAENLCREHEKNVRKFIKEMPSAGDLHDIRVFQAQLRDLVRRAYGQGGGGAAPNAADAEQIAALTAERDKLKDAAARARADFLNYQSRTAKDLERAEELALRKYVSELLPVLDSMDLSLMDAQNPSADVQRVREALQMINTSLLQVLQVRGLERIQAKGKTFDPNFHEAVVKKPADAAAGEKPNTVIEELRPGYLWKGLLLRPTQVLVTEPEKKSE